jgi:hypothetical protein
MNGLKFSLMGSEIKRRSEKESLFSEEGISPREIALKGEPYLKKSSDEWVPQ